MTADLRAEGITEALARLGDSPDAMADSLRTAGITGIREDGEHCPLANYLRREGFDGINVTRQDIEDALPAHDIIGDTEAWRSRWHMPTPPVARLFIMRFDDVVAGTYSDLADDA